jgi:hypothetical protein
MPINERSGLMDRFSSWKRKCLGQGLRSHPPSRAQDEVTVLRSMYSRIYRTEEAKGQIIKAPERKDSERRNTGKPSKANESRYLRLKSTRSRGKQKYMKYLIESETNKRTKKSWTTRVSISLPDRCERSVLPSTPVAQGRWMRAKRLIIMI